MNVAIYIEHRPESFTAPISITIKAKPSERLQAEKLATEIEELVRKEDS